MEEPSFDGKKKVWFIEEEWRREVCWGKNDNPAGVCAYLFYSSFTSDIFICRKSDPDVFLQEVLKKQIKDGLKKDGCCGPPEFYSYL